MHDLSTGFVGLFGKNRNCPLDITAVQKVYNRAKAESGVEKAKAFTRLRIVSPPTFSRVDPDHQDTVGS